MLRYLPTFLVWIAPALVARVGLPTPITPVSVELSQAPCHCTCKCDCSESQSCPSAAGGGFLFLLLSAVGNLVLGVLPLCRWVWRVAAWLRACREGPAGAEAVGPWRPAVPLALAAEPAQRGRGGRARGGRGRLGEGLIFDG